MANEWNNSLQKTLQLQFTCPATLSAAGESIRMLYVGSGGGLWLHGCVPWREFSFLVWHLWSKLWIFSISMSFSLGVTVDMASDILRSGSSDARPRDCSSSSMSHVREHETYICSSPAFASNVQLIDLRREQHECPVWKLTIAPTKWWFLKLYPISNTKCMCDGSLHSIVASTHHHGQPLGSGFFIAGTKYDRVEWWVQQIDLGTTIQFNHLFIFSLGKRYTNTWMYLC